MESEKISRENLITFLKEKKNYIKEKYEIEIVALFGSMARGNYNDDSDVDILYRPIAYDAFQLIDSIEYLKNRCNRNIELVSQNSINPIIEMSSKKERIYV